MTAITAIRSAETLAALRAVGAREASLTTKCDDHLAKRFLRPAYRLMAGVLPQSWLRLGLERAAPGGYCFAIARTRHFDELLLAEIRNGIEQVVLLGAGYDTRPYRFQSELQGIAVFEIDHPGTQARKKAMLAKAAMTAPANLTYIAVDFNREALPAALGRHAFSRDRKTLFLWEGVSYYLHRAAVESVLDFVGSCAAGSSVVFDYALQTFVDGDTSTHGGEAVARWLRKIGEPFLFGLDPVEAPAFLARRNLAVVSDLGPDELERAYLTKRDGGSLGFPLGHVRVAHARKASV
jgi:methyltransferase (TIGR00027 family)